MLKSLLVSIFIFFTCAIFANSATNDIHPVYVSLALVDYNSEEETLDISVKLFTDDLELAISTFSNQPDIRIGTGEDTTVVDSLISTYVNKKIQFYANGETENSELVYLGKEVELDVTWAYFRVYNIKELTSLETHCELFTELFPSQSTIMHINRKGEKKSMLFRKKSTIQNVDFNE